LERLAIGKHSSLSQTFINYSGKTFYNIGPRGRKKKEEAKERKRNRKKIEKRKRKQKKRHRFIKKKDHQKVK